MEIIGPRRLAVKSISGMAGSSRHRLILEAPPEVPLRPRLSRSLCRQATRYRSPSLSRSSCATSRCATRSGCSRSCAASTSSSTLPYQILRPQSRSTRAVSRGLRIFAAHARPFVRRSGKTLVVGSPSAVAKTLGTVTTRRYSVSYADIKKLPALITSLVSLEVKAIADERMRCLYITASPEGHQCVEALLNRLDSRASR